MCAWKGNCSELASSKRQIWGSLKSDGKAGNLISGGPRQLSWLVCLSEPVGGGGWLCSSKAGLLGAEVGACTASLHAPSLPQGLQHTVLCHGMPAGFGKGSQTSDRPWS